MKYFKGKQRPHEIECIDISEASEKEVIAWVEETAGDVKAVRLCDEEQIAAYSVKGRWGRNLAYIGDDYIVRNKSGDVWPMPKVMFESNYDVVEKA